MPPAQGEPAPAQGAGGDDDGAQGRKARDLPADASRVEVRSPCTPATRGRTRDDSVTSARGDDGGPVVRLGCDADAAAAGQLHAEQITGGFLAFLGSGFLTRLYRRVCRSSSSFLLVAEDGGRVVGFVAGSIDVPGLYRAFVLRDGLAAAFDALGPLLRGWRRAFETLRHGSSDGAGAGRGVELLAIAVDPSHRGRGIGEELVAAFLRQAAASHAHAAYVVVAADNVRAVGLYRRAGFVGGDEFELHAGTTSLLMQWDEKPSDEDAT